MSFIDLEKFSDKELQDELSRRNEEFFKITIPIASAKSILFCFSDDKHDGKLLKMEEFYQTCLSRNTKAYNLEIGCAKVKRKDI